MKVLLALAAGDERAKIERAVASLGHEVVSCNSAAQAWNRLRKDAHEVVIADWDAQQAEAAGLCSNIRSRTGGPYTFILVLLGPDQAQERDAVLAAGADDFQERPVDVTELAMRLDQARHLLSMQAGLREHRVDPTELGLANVKLGAILLREGFVTAEALEKALVEQARTGRRLGQVLVERGMVTREDILKARSIQLHVPFVEMPPAENPDPFIVEMVPHEIARRFRLLPLAIEQGAVGGRRLRVAMANPLDIEAIDLLQRTTGSRIEPYLADEDALLVAVARAYGAHDDSSAAFMEAPLPIAGLEIASVEDEYDDENEVLKQIEQAPVIKFVNTLISEAVRRRASDIHIEPYQKDFVIRYRIDGRLQTVSRPTRQHFAATASRIKVMADMDISERRLPLDGHITVRVLERACDLRVSTLPTQYGERITIRVLDRGAQCLDLDNLGFSARNLAAFRRLINRPHGLVLVTGPTGSGKTTTLYAALKALQSSTTNIITCEDPVEYRLDGISQSNVHERAGLTFARQLRAILRQDPDVILVGEIRDAETAEIAFRAALTGRLVLSTLHCNEAAGAVTRLLNIGLAPYLISSTLIGVVAQRLVVSLCPKCRRQYAPPPDELALFRDSGLRPASDLYEPVGCAACEGAGTRGRISIHEVLVSSDEIEELILQKASTAAIREAAQQAGMAPMLADGLDKAREGLTTLLDVRRKAGGAIEEDWFEPLSLAA